MNEILLGHTLETLSKIKKNSVHCVVTSPPYYGLRAYNTEPQTWPDGWVGELGQEPTPQMYIAHLVLVFREVKRALHSTGTCFVNIGDSYACKTTGSDGKSSTLEGGQDTRIVAGIRPDKMSDGLKSKDCIGIPWEFAKAMRDPYYTGSIKAEKDRVWMAAMMDGEGCISGFRHERDNEEGVRTGVNVCLTNTCVLMLNRAAEIYPASLVPHEQYNERLGNKPVFRWKPNGAENIANFLAEIYPYMITKKRQVMLAWNLMDFSKNGQKWGKSTQADQVRQKRDVLVKLISALNSGDGIDIPSWVTEPPSLYEPGWYWRGTNIWHKPNQMPASYTDRCTTDYEPILQFAKSERYYFDHIAIQEPASENPASKARKSRADNGAIGTVDLRGSRAGQSGESRNQDHKGPMRNKRAVWSISTKPYSGAHFAVFPEEIPELCIKAGTSERGCCPQCSAPWRRILEKIKGDPASFEGSSFTNGKTLNAKDSLNAVGVVERTIETRTVGWEPTCKCGDSETTPCVVLDPFLGSGTTAAVAKKIGRNWLGCELNAAYLDLAKRRIGIPIPLELELITTAAENLIELDDEEFF